jgi:anaerobic magnesium-protoporphyrin IX monomethyl ester cyclase
MQTMREYLRMAFQRVPVSIHRKDRFTRAAHELLAIPSRWRLDRDIYGFPFEIWLNQAARRVFKPLKPKVDAQQLSSEPVTC